MMLTRQRTTFLSYLSILLLLPLLVPSPGRAQVIRFENLTKIPGTDRSFPADDFITFHRSRAVVNSNGQTLKYTDMNRVRIHNDGTATLIIDKITTSNTSDFQIEGSPLAGGKRSIAPGKSFDITVRFTRFNGPPKAIVTQALIVGSNAINAGREEVTLRGAYMQNVEASAEINAQQIFESFGFLTRLGLDENGEVITKPGSLFPSEDDVNEGKEGDLILTRYFVRADPSKPVRVFQLAAFHGPGGAPTEFINARGQLVDGVRHGHNEFNHQTLLPRLNTVATDIANNKSDNINEPFQVRIAGYSTDGFISNGKGKEELLALRTYRVIDRDGRTLPNEYMINMDYIGSSGCGKGSANCDWNDNTVYLVNARPVAKPSAGTIPSLAVTAGKFTEYTVNGAFDIGFAGNKLLFTATLEGGGPLPEWLELDEESGAFTVEAPEKVAGELLRVVVRGTDYNGLTATAAPFVIAVGTDTDNCSVVANADGRVKSLDCNSGTVRLAGTSSNGNYRWSGPGGFSSNDRNPLVSVAGTYLLFGGEACQNLSSVEVSEPDNCKGGSVNAKPVAVAEASVKEGDAPLKVSLDGKQSSDRDGKIKAYAWAWAGGTATGKKAKVLFGEGNYKVTLTVTDDDGATATDRVEVSVRSEAPGRYRSFYLEAECAEVGQNWQVAGSDMASEGKYVSPTLNSVGSPPADVPANRVRFTVNQAEKGTYTLFARLAAPGGFADSYWVRVNGQAWYKWNQGITLNEGFRWNRPRDLALELKDGTNTIDFALREAGTRLDKLYIDKRADTPRAYGEPATNCGTGPVIPKPTLPNTPPVARAGATAVRGVAPFTTTLDGSASTDLDGTISDYEWKWSGGNFSTVNAEITFPAGTYVVTLTVTDDGGATDSDVITLTVTDQAIDPPTGDNPGDEFWLEAECAVVGSRWTTQSDPAAAAGSYVVVNSGNAMSAPPGNGPGDYVRFTLEDATAGNYRMYVRIGAENGLNDSFWVRVNEGNWYEWKQGIRQGKGYGWNQYSEGLLSIVGGVNSIDFAYRENGTRLDKVYLTKTGREPSTTGQTDPNCDAASGLPALLTVEAECGRLDAGWQTVSDDRASLGSYLVFTGDRQVAKPGAGPTGIQVTTEVNVPTAGEYQPYLRIDAPDNSSNSLWVAVDGGEWLEFWKEADGSNLLTNGFEWRRVTDNGEPVVWKLSAGIHTIAIGNREPGTGLDKLYLAADGEAPVGFGPQAATCNVTASATPVNRSSIVTGISEQEMTVYPNPAADRASLEVSGEYRGRVVAILTDATGRRVSELDLDKRSHLLRYEIDLGNLTPGLYRLMIITGEGQRVLPLVRR